MHWKKTFQKCVPCTLAYCSLWNSALNLYFSKIRNHCSNCVRWKSGSHLFIWHFNNWFDKSTYWISIEETIPVEAHAIETNVFLFWCCRFICLRSFEKIERRVIIYYIKLITSLISSHTFHFENFGLHLKY